MSLNVNGSVRVTSGFTETITVGLGSAGVSEGIAWLQQYGTGTGAGNINEKWSKTSTPAASTPDTWTLSALTDTISGSGSRTIAFAKAKSLIINNTGSCPLILTAGASHGVAWLPPSGAQGVTIPAGGIFVLEDPTAGALTVTASTNDTIKIDPGTNSGAAYSIEIAGE
ncbi:MAG: hypothetical protein P4L84_11145 [Isosphaeraceae bacterium]|nr:hypothetical protein [Isosphaeraceae bacterium]